MESVHEKYKRLSKEVATKYAAYLSVHRKATKNKDNIALRTAVENKRREWLQAIAAKKMA